MAHPGASAASGAPSATSIRARRPAGTMRTDPRPPAGRQHGVEREPSRAMTFGGRSATPCESSVRARSTGSPPAPRSSIPEVRVTPGMMPHAAAGAGSSIRRGSSVSRAITRRWICDVPS